MLDFLLDMLQCPDCHAELEWDIQQREGERIIEAQATCTHCNTAYPVREGIGGFLISDLPREDLWSENESHLQRFLREHPQDEKRLMSNSPDKLDSIDLFFRAIVHEERGEYQQANDMLQRAHPDLYTTEYLACLQSEIDFVLEQLTTGPVVDLASGRCELAGEIARHYDHPLVITDFSPRILRRDRAWLQSLDVYDNVSLLAFDAQHTPFKGGAVATLTTNQGLANIDHPGDLLKELRRIAKGKLYAISQFYPPGDEANTQAIRGFGFEQMLFEASARQQFEQAGWQIKIENRCMAHVRPTLESAVLDASVEAQPKSEIELTWCVLTAQ